jgi:hypothetical protein
MRAVNGAAHSCKQLWNGPWQVRGQLPLLARPWGQSAAALTVTVPSGSTLRWIRAPRTAEATPPSCRSPR